MESDHRGGRRTGGRPRGVSVKVRFVTPAKGVVLALKAAFAGCDDVDVTEGTYADVRADAEYVSISVVLERGVVIRECEARVLSWKDIGLSRDVPYVVVGGIVPHGIDPMSVEASVITFTAVLNALMEYNASHQQTIRSVRILADWFVSDDSTRTGEDCAALRGVYDTLRPGST